MGRMAGVSLLLAANLALVGAVHLQVTLDAPELATSSDASGEFPVVTDGTVEDNWEPVADEQDTTVSITNMPQNKFKLLSSGDTMNFQRPVIEVGNSSVLSPQVMGAARRGGMVKKQASVLTIKYNCISPGTSTVMVTLPFANPEEGNDEPVNIEWMWTVDCESNPREGFVIKQTPSMGQGIQRVQLSGAGAFVAQDGKALDQWAVVQMGLARDEFVPKAEPGELFTVDGDSNITRFILGMQLPTGTGRKSISQSFLTPKIVVTPSGQMVAGEIASPVLLGTGRKGGNLRDTGSTKVGRGGKAGGGGQGLKDLMVKYNCIAVGSVMITVTIPFPDNNFKPVVFTWKKTCGGGTIKDLSIVNALDEPVVAEGEVMPAFVPVSGDYTVDSLEVSTTFSMTRGAGQTQGKRFGTPKIESVPSDVCNPSIDGNGRKGGMIRGKGKSAAEVTVLYNCVKRGSVTITMTIPFTMNPDVVVSWTKTCGGIPRQYFSVTTWESPVVKDGVAYDDWSPEFVGESFAAVVDSSDDITSLYLSLDAQDESTVAFYEPDWSDWMDDVESPSVPANLMAQTYQRPMIEVSNTQICNPSLSNIASKGGTITSYGDEQQMDVTYNCLKPGSTTVTITIPCGVYSDIVFSWTKRCNKVFVEGLSVGTASGADDVLTDGHAQVYFDTSAEAEGRRMVVDKDTLDSSFFVMVDEEGKPLGFGEPMITASPPICNPRITGTMRKGGELRPGASSQLDIRYNCFVGGSTVITMRIPLEDDSLEALTWAWRKNNGPAPAVQMAIDHESHYDSQEVMSLLVLVVALLGVVYCISGKLGKNESHGGFSRVPTQETWGDSAKRH